MLTRTANSTQPDRRLFGRDSYSDTYAVGIAAIWIVFYAVIGVAAVVHGVSGATAIH